MKIMKKITALLLTAAMCLSFTACSDDGIAMEIEGQEIPAGIYIIQQLSALNEAVDSEDYNAEIGMWDNEIDGKPIIEWVEDKAMENMKVYGQINKMFDEANLELDEDALDAIDYAVETYWPTYEAAYQKIGISKSSYELYETNNQKYKMLFLHYYGENGTEPIKDEDLKDYYATDFAQFQVIGFSTLDPKTFTALEGTAKQAVKENAQAYLKRAQDGEDMVDLINERAAEYAKELGEDAPEVDESADYIYTIKKDTDSYYVSSDVAADIFSSVDIGEIALLDDNNGYYVVKRLEVSPDQEDFEELRNTLLADLKNDDFVEILTAKSADLDVKLHEKSIKRYKVKKLDKLF